MDQWCALNGSIDASQISKAVTINNEATRPLCTSCPAAKLLLSTNYNGQDYLKIYVIHNSICVTLYNVHMEICAIAQAQPRASATFNCFIGYMMNKPPLNYLKVCVDGDIHRLNAGLALAASYGSKLIYNVWLGKLKALELLKYSLKSMNVPYTEDIITTTLPDGKTVILFRAKAYLLDLVEWESARLINYVAISSNRSYSIIKQKDYFKLDLATILSPDTSESK